MSDFSGKMEYEAFVVDMMVADRYLSPRCERSRYKGIPMKFRDTPVIQSLLKSGKYLIRYRGPRRPGRLGQQMCLKNDATHFSIYCR